MPTQTIAVPKPLLARERGVVTGSTGADTAVAPSTPPAVSRLPLFRGIAPGDEADEPAAAGSAPSGRAPPCKQTLAPLTPPSSPPASPVNAEPANSAQADGDTVDGETVIVFDWDDTLMATTVLTRQYCFDVDATDRLPGWLVTQLTQLEDAAIRALRVAHKCSHRVVLLTNAGDGWVEHSGQRFLPRVTQAIDELRIPIVSAQVEYGEMCPGNPGEWKKRAFVEKITGRSLNLISIGDSVFERIAAKHAGRTKDGHYAHTKTVKFVDSPSLKKLESELHVLADQLDDICELQCSADWNLTLSKAAPRAGRGSGEQWTARVELCR